MKMPFWLWMTLFVIALNGSAIMLYPYLGNWLIIPYGALVIGGFVLLRTKLRNNVVFMADVWITNSFLLNDRADKVAEDIGESSASASVQRLSANLYQLGAEMLYAIAGTKERSSQ